MPTPTKGARLGGGPAHERLMLANLATALFTHGRIKTTAAKAKRLRPLAERLITKAKKGDLHARRQVLTVVRDKDVVYRLFDEIAPTYVGRLGGYTRTLKLGARSGDNAPMVLIELVEGGAPAATEEGKQEAAAMTRAESMAAMAGGRAVVDDDDDADAPAASTVASDVDELTAKADADDDAPAEKSGDK